MAITLPKIVADYFRGGRGIENAPGSPSKLSLADLLRLAYDDLFSLDAGATALEGRVTTAEGDISANVGDISALDGRATALEGDVATLQESFSPSGAMLVSLINKTGGATVRGTIVEPSDAVDLAFKVCGADEPDAIGVVYDDGIADGQPCRIVVHGPAQVLLVNTVGTTRSWWARTSVTVGGRADTAAGPPGGGIVQADQHFREIGHVLESKGG